MLFRPLYRPHAARGAQVGRHAPMAIIGVKFRLKGNQVTMTETVATEDGFNQIADAIQQLSEQMSKFLGAVYRVLPP